MKICWIKIFYARIVPDNLVYYNGYQGLLQLLYTSAKFLKVKDKSSDTLYYF